VLLTCRDLLKGKRDEERKSVCAYIYINKDGTFTSEVKRVDGSSM
jgi:hypothetical protein